MDKFVVNGGRPLSGEITIGGAKNVALKVFIAALLTDDELIIHNVPLIADVTNLLEVLRELGVQTELSDHTVRLRASSNIRTNVPLEVGARFRTASLAFGPMLARWGEAMIPNPGGCRLGARPIDRHIDAFMQMGADITYNSNDGYFHGKAEKLKGTEITFAKNTHTGTEAVILAAVLAEGKTVIKNAAAEVEIDDLIALLNLMGANVTRVAPREIVIVGVKKLHGGQYKIMADRNEEVTFAIAAAATNGTIVVTNSQLGNLQAFLDPFIKAGGGYEIIAEGKTRYFRKSSLQAVDVATAPHPGFMTDWQGPWALLMTQASGASTIHETVFEKRFSYVEELKKMGAQIEFYTPEVKNPEVFYNFNWSDHEEGDYQGIKISGHTKLHNAILEMGDLRAGATLVLAALTAGGESYIHGTTQIDRGYERIEERLQALGANIQRIRETI